MALIRLLGDLPAMGADAGLTGRETSVLALLSAGCSTWIIARRLGCTPRTVDNISKRIYRKLGVRDRLDAVRVAQAWGRQGHANG